MNGKRKGGQRRERGGRMINSKEKRKGGRGRGRSKEGELQE